MKMKIIRLILFAVSLPLLSNAQLDELKNELFANQKFTTYIVDSTDVRCSLKHMNKSIFKESEKVILDEEAVLKILKEITFEPYEVNQDSLHDIYLKFAYKYYQDWGEVYLNLCIPESDRKEAEKQFKILTGFEHALKSVSLKYSTAEEIWNKIKEEHQLFNELIYNSSEISTTLDEIETFSKEYKKLNSKAWYASSCGFTYHEPYINKVKEFYINELNQCKCPFEDEECDISFIKQNTHYIALIKDERVAKAFIENKDCLNLNPNYFWFPVRYLEKNHNPDLVRITLRVLFESEHAGHIDYKIAHIFRNKENREIFQEELSSGIELLQITAIENSWRHANKQTCKSLKRAKKKCLKNSDLRKLIEQQLKRVKFKMKHDS